MSHRTIEIGLLRLKDEGPEHYIAVEPVAEFVRLADLMIFGSLAMQMESHEAYKQARDRIKGALAVLGHRAGEERCGDG